MTWWRSLFTLMGTKGVPKSGKDLSWLRITQGTQKDGSTFEIEDDWKNLAMAHRMLPESWVGATTFCYTRKPQHNLMTSHHTNPFPEQGTTGGAGSRGKDGDGGKGGPDAREHGEHGFGQGDHRGRDQDDVGDDEGAARAEEKVMRIEHESEDIKVVSWEELRFGVGAMGRRGDV